MFPKTDIKSGWGAGGTEGGAHGSFFKRYYKPLARYCRYKFGVSDHTAEDLVSQFMTRELEREIERDGAIFRLFDSRQGRFRSYLASAFWRFARDELEKEQRRNGLFLEDLEGLQEQGADDYEFCRLVAREFFNNIRSKIESSLESENLRACLALKWPADSDTEPKNNAEIERTLGLSRETVRTLSRTIADRFTYTLYKELHSAGLSSEDAKELLGDCCRILDREQKSAEKGVSN